MIQCSSCNVDKPSSAFKKRKDSKTGFRGQCIICFNKKVRELSLENKEKKRLYDLNYRKLNKDRIKTVQKEYSIKNADKIRSQRKIYREENKDIIRLANIKYRVDNSEKIKSRKRDYSQKNKHIVNSISARRRSCKLNATPPWSEKNMINEVYRKAKEYSTLLGIEMVVDHIIPLNNKDVCGLHVWANLQLLERSLNTSKSNKFNLKRSKNV